MTGTRKLLINMWGLSFLLLKEEVKKDLPGYID